MKKLKEKSGVAILIWILVLANIVMLVLILTPLVRKADNNTRAQMDQGHEQTATDSALLRYFADGSFTAIYDMQEKQFVLLSSAGQIVPYGESDEHQGLVILVKADDSGNIKVTWVDPKSSNLQRYE